VISTNNRVACAKEAGLKAPPRPVLTDRAARTQEVSTAAPGGADSSVRWRMERKDEDEDEDEDD